MWYSKGSRTPLANHVPLPATGKKPAAPDLTPDDIERIHGLWLELSEALPGAELHHSDVVTLALQHLQRQFEGPAGDGIFEGIRRKQARQSEGRRGNMMLKTGTTAFRIDTPMLRPLVGGSKQTRRIPGLAPSLRRTGDRRRRSQALSFWGSVFSFCIPIVLLVGAIWNPAGVEGSALMAFLAVLVALRLGIGVAKRR